MKTCIANLLCCMAACVALSLISCGDDDDWDYYRGGYNNGGNNNNKPEPVRGFTGQWKGSVPVKCYVFGTTFTADEVYVKIDANENNSTIGTGELQCFYDDEQCPVEAESIYFTWYEKDGVVVIDVPCDASLSCTVENWSVSNGTLTGVAKGDGFSTVLSLNRLDGYKDWDVYADDTKYAVFYRNQPIKGEWTGDLGFSYEEGDVVYEATANIRFQPKDKDGLRGVGEEIEFYEKPCPLYYESLYFTWEMVNGVLQLTYPYNEDMNMDIYQILQTDDTFEARYNDGGEMHLIKLTGYTDWNLYDKTTGYGRDYYDETPSASVRRMMSATALCGHRTIAHRTAARSQRRTVSNN